MDIRFACPEGHRLRATTSMEGKLCVCPVCDRPARVPRQSSNRITDTGVMRILGDADLDSDLDDGPAVTAGLSKNCPKCRKRLPASATVCDNCKLYVDVTKTVWERHFQATEK